MIFWFPKNRTLIPEQKINKVGSFEIIAAQFLNGRLDSWIPIAEVQETTLVGDYAGALTQLDRLMSLHETVFTEPGCRRKMRHVAIGLSGKELRPPLTGPVDGKK